MSMFNPTPFADRVLPTEDQAFNWHSVQVAELMSNLADLQRDIGYHLTDDTAHELLSGVSHLVMDAYAAGRLNPLPFQAPAAPGVVGAMPLR